MLRILHVEDDRAYLGTVRAALAAQEDIVLEQVETLAAAQERLADPNGAAFDVLLVDLRLPDAREMEAVAALRVYGIPLVVLSAVSLPETLERAAEAGADDYLVKGLFDGGQLIRRVRFACRRHAKQMETMASAVNLATSSRSPFSRRGFAEDAFEALKPFISCGRVA
jgi:DNA-binding response OmpR family regulator